MLHKCSYCTYHTTVKYNLRRHIKNKHGNHPNSAQPVAASNPHPYVHPYINNASQQPITYQQRTPEMVANNTYYAKETRAPTKISVGPNGPRAPTTFSVELKPVVNDQRLTEIFFFNFGNAGQLGFPQLTPDNLITAVFEIAFGANSIKTKQQFHNIRVTTQLKGQHMTQSFHRTCTCRSSK